MNVLPYRKIKSKEGEINIHADRIYQVYLMFKQHNDLYDNNKFNTKMFLKVFLDYCGMEYINKTSEIVNFKIINREKFERSKKLFIILRDNPCYTNNTKSIMDKRNLNYYRLKYTF